MDINEKCLLLKICISEDAQFKGHSMYDYIVKQCKAAGMAGATVYRGIEGYGRANKLHAAKVLELSGGLPIIIEIVDQEEKIERLLPMIREIVHEGLVITQDVRVIKYE